MYILFTFNSTHHAILTEKLFMESNITVKLIPVPRAISASCGLAARICDNDRTVAFDLINKNNIETTGTYIMDINSNIKTFSDKG